MKPTIALVQGDATGIGPELTAKLLAEAQSTKSMDHITRQRVTDYEP